MGYTRNPSPVLGEIVTPGPIRADAILHAGLSARADVLDAEFETVRAEPALRGFQPLGEPATGFDSLKPAEPVVPQFAASRRAGPVFWAVGITVAFLSFWMAGGHTLLPLSGPVAGSEVPGLKIVTSSTRIEQGASGPILFVEGVVANSSASTLLMPSLGVDVRSVDGSLTRYMIGTGTHELAPGTRFDFSSRLAVPPAGVDTVSVHLGTIAELN